MIGETVSHYSALWNPAPWRNPRKRDKILEKLGEGGMSPACQGSPTLAGREHHPRILLSGMSDCDVQDPPLSRRRDLW